jgi:effector-binding domain-containing protein
MLDKPYIVQTKTQPAAVIRLTVPRGEIGTVMGPAIGEVMSAVAAQGVKPAGPVFSHHFKMDPKVFDFEIGVPVESPVRAAGRVKPGELPGATVARTVYRGPYEGLGKAWGEFDSWITENKHEPSPNLWESYVSGPEAGAIPATELNRPIVR